MSERSTMEMYQAFMAGYVKRINEATLKVTIGGIRIGTAKYSRLAQINLHSRIITFSRFAIENVPERGRRYLVLHELAHVREASHNRGFWELVAGFEPNYKQIGHALDLAFKRNVKEHQQAVSQLKVLNPLSGRHEDPKLLLAGSRLLNFDAKTDPSVDFGVLDQVADDADSAGTFECMEDEFDVWNDASSGAVYGGGEEELVTAYSGSTASGSLV